MQDLLQAHIANGFAAFTGAVVTASIPVKDTLLNELIASYLTQARSGSPATGASSAFDVQQVLPLVRTVTVQAGPGVVTLHVELAVEARADGR